MSHIQLTQKEKAENTTLDMKYATGMCKYVTGFVPEVWGEE